LEDILRHVFVAMIPGRELKRAIRICLGPLRNEEARGELAFVAARDLADSLQGIAVAARADGVDEGKEIMQTLARVALGEDGIERGVACGFGCLRNIGLRWFARYRRIHFALGADDIGTAGR